MDYNRENNFIIEEEFLGFFETELNISIKNVIPNVAENCNLNLHYLFSFYDNNLFCRCLDFDMYSHLNLKSEIKEKHLKQSGEDALNDFAKEIISDVSKSLTLNIIDYLETLRNDEKENFVWYSHEYYWEKYRAIRQERDNHNLNKLFYPNKEIKNFITLSSPICELQ